MIRPAFEGTSFTIGCKGFRAMGHHEAIALRRRLEVPTATPTSTPTLTITKRFKQSESSDKVAFQGEEEFWDEEFEDGTEFDDYDFISEIQKVIKDF